MCLSTVYRLTDGGREKLLEYVSLIRVAPGKVYLTDIMGAETEVPGFVRSMDLVNNEVILSEREN